MPDIVTITVNPVLDKSAEIEQVAPDRKLRCQPPRFEPGGGGINVSRAIQQLGGDSLAVFTTGGPFGKMFERLLDEEGVSSHPLPISGYTRESFTVFERASSQQFRFIMPGPELRQTEWKDCLSAVADISPAPKYIVASGSLPPGAPEDFYGRLAEVVKGSDSKLIVDTSGGELRAAVEHGVYLLKPNMRELKDLAGGKIETEEELEQVAEQLVENGKAQVVIVSLGAAGALLVAEGVSERVRAPTVQIRSKIGAGDSMVAGIVLALSRGQSLSEAARYGVAAGAAAVSTPGTELCPRDLTDSLFRKISETAEMEGVGSGQ